MKTRTMERRRFLKSTAVAGSGLLILPSGVLFGQDAPSNKLNIALIGAYGRAAAHYNALSTENVVALCDVNELNLAQGVKRFPGAKTYVDWRKCIEQSDLDAVVCCTPDHHHAFVGNWALNRGLHVYMEKPLGLSIEEVRTVRENYLKNKGKLATQHGTQRHAFPNFNRVRELIHDGAIGELQAVHAWGDRQFRKSGYLPAEGSPPATLDYDQWIGPSPYHPYNPDYFSGSVGMNCLQWNMYWDFGNGQVGDMGSHTMDLAWNVIEAGLPVSAEAFGEPFNPEVTPVELTAMFELPANDWRPAIPCAWYQGGHMPQSPLDAVHLSGSFGHGVLFKGSKGYVVSSFDNRILIPFGDEADLTYYHARSKEELEPPITPSFQGEWINACKGDLKTSCDFEYGGNEMEMMDLGLVAYRFPGEKLEYDGKEGKVTNLDAANAFLSRKYRPGWELDG
ncbi:Gfo/Idh/MocA family oxidoreductase [bacterium]|nr:Gfo/Idh/MocA family oxidoreductase [bacterium]